MTIESIINSEEQLRNYIKDLDTLHEISAYRHKKGYEDGKRFNDVKILHDFIWLDACGNTMVRVNNNGYYSPICLPNKSDECPVCGKGWNLYSLEDVVTEYDYEVSRYIFTHKRCKNIQILNESVKQFTQIFNCVYPGEYTYKFIPNEYCSYDLCKPWFIFTTPNGDIKIGWRKRVINIEWLNTYKHFTDDFESEDVTKWFDEDGRGIHAWSVEKCCEYLRRAKNS